MATSLDAVKAATTGALSPVAYGGKGDGSTDDSTAINSTVSTAKSNGRAVHLGGRKWKTGGGGNYEGVTITTGTIQAAVTNAQGKIFSWGGDGSSLVDLAGVVSNSAATEMMGIYNSQRGTGTSGISPNPLVGQRVHGLTLKVTGKMHAVWFDPAACRGIHLDACHVELKGGTGYGLWIDSMGRPGNRSWDQTDYLNAPVGPDIEDIKFTNCTVVGGVIGVNTPAIMARRVHITGCTVHPNTDGSQGVMPISVAHANKVIVTGNILEGSMEGDANNSGTLHIEDATREYIVADNIVRQYATTTSGIIITDEAGISKDTTTVAGVGTIRGNLVLGPGKATSQAEGIVQGSLVSSPVIMSDNWVEGWEYGIVAFSGTEVRGGRVLKCATGIRTGGTQRVRIDGVQFQDCTQAVQIDGASSVEMTDCTLVNSPLPTSGGKLWLRQTAIDLGDKAMTDAAWVDLIPAPKRGCTGTIEIRFQSGSYNFAGNAKWTWSGDETTQTITRVAAATEGNWNPQLRVNGGMLQYSQNMSAPDTMRNVALIVDGLVF